MSLVSNASGMLSTIGGGLGPTELDVPFRFDGTGGVAVTTDEFHRAVQHMLAIAMTAPSERVMRPTYGVGLQNLVFEPGDVVSFQQAALALQTAFAATETSVATITVSVLRQSPGVYVFQVDFSLDQDPTIDQALFDYAGNIVGSS